jgi:hypothetical protein
MWDVDGHAELVRLGLCPFLDSTLACTTLVEVILESTP